MPYVNVRITKDGVTAEQKSRIIAEITQTLSSILSKKPERTHVVIDEVELENWGIGGVPASEFRRQND